MTTEREKPMMPMILAIRDSQIVGALLAGVYDGAEEAWPCGWGELDATGEPFDVIDVDLPMEMAMPMVEKYNPTQGDDYPV